MLYIDYFIPELTLIGINIHPMMLYTGGERSYGEGACDERKAGWLLLIVSFSSFFPFFRSSLFFSCFDLFGWLICYSFLRCIWS